MMPPELVQVIDDKFYFRGELMDTWMDYWMDFWASVAISEAVFIICS
jgi:hypothetical protein